MLVANLTYSAFISLFPLLLVLTPVLGLTAAVDEGFRQAAITAVASQFPLIGHELTGNVHQLRRSSVIGLIVGLAGLVWGATGLAQAGLFTMEQVWNLPGPARPGYPRGVPTRDLVRGAVIAGILWTALQAGGAYLVHHYLHSDSVYGVFATVLGLVAWLYIAVQVTVYAAEINVVLARRLWPRAIVQPPLTEADRASMALQTLQNQRREEQQIHVTYRDRQAGTEPPATTPQTPADVSPPAPRTGD